MTHNPTAVTELHKSINRLRELGAFDQDAYMEALRLLNKLRRSFATKNVKQVEADMSKIARLIANEVGRHRGDER